MYYIPIAVINISEISFLKGKIILIRGFKSLNSWSTRVLSETKYVAQSHLNSSMPHIVGK